MFYALFVYGHYFFDTANFWGEQVFCLSVFYEIFVS